MKKVAILGAGSFLAKNLIKYCVDNEYDYEFFLYGRKPVPKSDNIHYVRVDFTDIHSVNCIDFSVDIIMIFMGKTGTVNGFEEYAEFVQVNEIALLNVLKKYVEKKSKALIIYPSSRLLFKSDEKAGVNEDSARECKSIYAVTKHAAENYLKIYKESFGVNYVVIRICTPVGTLLDEFGNYGTFEIFKNQAIRDHGITIFGDGGQTKTFTNIKDICKAFTLIIDEGKTNYNEYNLGGQKLTMMQIAHYIAAEYNVLVKSAEWPKLYKEVDGGSVFFDSSRFDKEFHMSYTFIQLP